jgi:hypothetical protein
MDEDANGKSDQWSRVRHSLGPLKYWEEIMKKLLYSGLALVLLTSATAIGARPVKLPQPPTAASSSLPLVVWFSLLTTGVL